MPFEEFRRKGLGWNENRGKRVWSDWVNDLHSAFSKNIKTRSSLTLGPSLFFLCTPRTRQHIAGCQYCNVVRRVRTEYELSDIVISKDYTIIPIQRCYQTPKWKVCRFAWYHGRHTGRYQWVVPSLAQNRNLNGRYRGRRPRERIMMSYSHLPSFRNQRVQFFNDLFPSRGRNVSLVQLRL